MRVHVLAGVLLLGMAGGIADAGVIFSVGNIPQTDSAVLFNCPTICTDGPGNLIIGHLQQVTPDTAVDFMSEESIQVTGPGFNAVSGTSSTSGFDDLAITVPGDTFTSIIFQLTSLASATDGTATFTAILANGTTHVTSGALFDSHTGGNYFTITTTMGDSIKELDIATTQFQDNISQVRIGGVSNTNIVPEPVTSGCVGVLLIGMALIARRRTS